MFDFHLHTRVSFDGSGTGQDMALAAKAFGANGYFFEVHPTPDEALSDGPTMLYLNDLEKVISSLL